MATAAVASPSRIPFIGRINPRAALLVLVLLSLVAYPFYRWFRVEHADRIAKSDPAGTFVEVDLKRLADFPLDQVNGKDEDIPQRWRDLNGRRVVLVGEMAGGQSMAGADSDFDLVWSTRGRGEPQVQTFIKCDVPDGKTVEHHYGLVSVKGTLQVGVTRGESGRIGSVYRLTVESLEPK